MNYETCSMKLVANVQAVRDGNPGSFFVEDATIDDETFKRLWAKLPDGTVGGFALDPAPAHIPGIWAWNRSEKKPTLKRPITLRGRWCGQIKAGRMVSDPAPAEPAAAVEQPPPMPSVASIPASTGAAGHSDRAVITQGIQTKASNKAS